MYKVKLGNQLRITITINTIFQICIGNLLMWTKYAQMHWAEFRNEDRNRTANPSPWGPNLAKVRLGFIFSTAIVANAFVLPHPDYIIEGEVTMRL
jgi:hypothetical protein